MTLFSIEIRLKGLRLQFSQFTDVTELIFDSYRSHLHFFINFHNLLNRFSLMYNRFLSSSFIVCAILIWEWVQNVGFNSSSNTSNDDLMTQYFLQEPINFSWGLDVRYFLKFSPDPYPKDVYLGLSFHRHSIQVQHFRSS